MQVVGKRHYGRKAVPHGGGGGRERARESFDSCLLWQARVTLDANGEASVTVPLNDSLTSFRIVAVAHAGAQLFGTGSASIATHQDLILLSGLPPLVREGDRYRGDLHRAQHDDARRWQWRSLRRSRDRRSLRCRAQRVETRARARRATSPGT